MSGRQVHRLGTTALSVAMVAIGIALVAQAVGGGGALLTRLAIGVLFCAAGLGRLYVEIRVRRGGGSRT